jgi:hypothetical protein
MLQHRAALRRGITLPQRYAQHKVSERRGHHFIDTGIIGTTMASISSSVRPSAPAMLLQIAGNSDVGESDKSPVA